MKKTKIQKIKTVGILTSGGDSPGMNTTIRGAARQALALGIKPFLIYEGYKGIIEENIKEVEPIELDKFISRGGTHIYSSRFPKFLNLATQKRAAAILKQREIDGLVVIGGNGSYKGAEALHKLGVKVVGLPGTIDNDIDVTETTIGFDSALDTIVRTVDILRNTAQSHDRLFIVEVMGRHCPDLAIYAGLATGAEAVVTSQNNFEIKDFIQVAKKARKNGKRSIIIIVSERIYGLNGKPSLDQIAKEIIKQTKIDTRTMVVGHLQRGALPTAMERVRATLFGINAINELAAGKSGIAIGNMGENFFSYPISKKDPKKRTAHKNLISIVNRLSIE